MPPEPAPNPDGTPIEKLDNLRLGGMVTALKEQQDMDLDDLSFEERLWLLVDRETVEPDNRWRISCCNITPTFFG